MGAGRISGFTTGLSDIDTAAQEYLGSIREEYNQEFKYVQFSGTNAVAIGDAVCYVLTDTTLRTVDFANSAIGAGIAVAAHPSGQVTFGWVQVKGVVQLGRTPSGTLAAGGGLTNGGAANGVLAITSGVLAVVGQLITTSSPYMANLSYNN